MPIIIKGEINDKKRIISVFFIIIAVVLFAFMFLPSVVDQETEVTVSKFEFLRYAFETDFEGSSFWEHAYVWGTIMQILSIVFLIIVSFLSIFDNIKLKTLLKLACLHWCAVSVLFLAYINSAGSLWSIGSILSILVDIMEIAVAGRFLRIEKKDGKKREKKAIDDTNFVRDEIVTSTIIIREKETKQCQIALAKEAQEREEARQTIITILKIVGCVALLPIAVCMLIVIIMTAFTEDRYKYKREGGEVKQRISYVNKNGKRVTYWRRRR